MKCANLPNESILKISVQLDSFDNEFLQCNATKWGNFFLKECAKIVCKQTKIFWYLIENPPKDMYGWLNGL